MMEKILIYQSETWGTLDSIIDYYKGPNHHSMDGFAFFPFTYGITETGETIKYSQDSISPIGNEYSIIIQGCYWEDTFEEKKQLLPEQIKAIEDIVKEISLREGKEYKIEYEKF